MRRMTRRFRPVLECLEERVTPSNFNAVITGTTLTITKTTTGLGSDLTVTSAATPGELTITSNAGDTIANGNFFTTPKPVTTVVFSLGKSGTAGNNNADTLSFDGTAGNGPINLTGGLSITGADGDMVLSLTQVNLQNAAALKVSRTGNGNLTSTFTNVNVGGAATFTHPGVGSDTLILTNSANPGPNVVFHWGSLSVTNGAGADSTIIRDTSFAGNVTINNGPGDGTTNPVGGSQTRIGVLNDQTLATIGGNLTITTTSGMSNSEVSDYNVKGNVTINTGPGILNQALPNFVGVEDRQTFTTSGTPAIGGNVSITGSAASPSLFGGTGLTIAVGTSTNLFVIRGGLTVSATDTVDAAANPGSVNLTLTNLRITTRATSITLSNRTANDTVTIAGANTLSIYGSLSLTSNATGSNTFNIQNTAGETDFGDAVSLQLVNRTGTDTIQMGDFSQNPPPNEDGKVVINGNLGITGSGTKIITVQGTQVAGSEGDEGNLNISLTGVPPVGNFVMQATFTDSEITGAATVSAPQYSGDGFTITTSAAANPNTLLEWGSLTMTNGEDARVTVNDTDFAGNVTITNLGNTDGDGVITTSFGALHSQNLATIGGDLTVSNASGPPSDTEVSDYNVNGNVSIKSAPANTDFVGLENIQTFPGSGTPVIGGNVTIGAGSKGGVVAALLAAIDVGTGGKDPFIFGGAASNNPLYIAGNLTVNVTGDHVQVNLNDLSVPNGTTSVNLGATAVGGDTVQVQGSSVTSVFGNFNLTSAALGNNTFNLQDQAGTLVFGGAVKVQLAGGANTLNLAADANNTAGVPGAVVDFLGTSAFSGGAGATSTLFGLTNGIPDADLFSVFAPVFHHFLGAP